MCAQIKFYTAAEAAGIKPICGSDLWIESSKNQTPSRLTVLCMNELGYRNLMEIISLSFQLNQHRGKALCKKEWLFEKSNGLIILSGGREGNIGNILLSNHPEDAK